MYFPKKPKFFSISAAKTLKMSFVYNYVYSSKILEKSPTSTEMLLTTQFYKEFGGARLDNANLRGFWQRNFLLDFRDENL